MIRTFIKDYDDTRNPEVRKKYGMLAGGFGIFCNIMLAVLKVVIGIMSGAFSIVGDAINNMSDAASSIVTLISFKLSGKPADREHPYGHGRLEYVSGFIVAVLVLAIALNLFKESIVNIVKKTPISVSIVTIIILSGTILIKLYMSIFYMHISRTIKSAAMRVTAVDSRSDCICTSVALVSVLVMLCFKVNIDGYAGAIVALFVIKAGLEGAKETTALLLGEGPDEELKEKILQISSEYKDIIEVHDLRVHDYGPGRTFASMHVEMNSELGMMRAHEIVDDIERRAVREGLVSEFTIHVDPVDENDDFSIKTKRIVEEKIKKINECIKIHDFRVTHNGTLVHRMAFDVTVPYDFNKTDNEIMEDVKEVLKDTPGNPALDILVDRS
ncbi:cation diffusion facilitator family transporter [Eubacterium ruminantium]|nr:cation diffusion facilitator family transporter [Eubacterium ruminantium]